MKIDFYNGKCFSRSGWWQTLCGLDAANQGFGWTDKPDDIGCSSCKKLIKLRFHLERIQKIILCKDGSKEYIKAVNKLWKEKG